MDQLTHPRGADIVAKTLTQMGVTKLFALSGNHVMPIFDALFGTKIQIIHTRHEAACVHMADAWGRLTNTAGFALVTGGQAHANGSAALFTSLASESPLVLLSGHAALEELGHGAFQEMRQADLARPASKASWVVETTRTLGRDIARAAQIACSGRPGPVHVSLPVDLLERIPNSSVVWPHENDWRAAPILLPEADTKRIIAEMGRAKRPMVLCGPVLCTPQGRSRIHALEAVLEMPVIGMESPRGVNDPSLGAFAELLAQADLIVLLGKPLDFTLQFGHEPFVSVDCKFVAIDSEPAILDRAATLLKLRLIHAAEADAMSAIAALTSFAHGSHVGAPGWLNSVKTALAFRPPEWQTFTSRGKAMHPFELCRVLNSFVKAHPETMLVCDGGEVGQWAQALVQPHQRIINGISGTIGASIPFAIAAKALKPANPMIAVVGDGAFGFHMAEFDTAVRYGLPIIVVIGNDARWNAEYQIQLRKYGAERARSCDLLPTSYEKAVEALGGWGRRVSSHHALAAAIEEAHGSRKPSCINVDIESVPAPIVRRER
jgi:acetolactate synthase-1/2/3 large subunit